MTRKKLPELKPHQQAIERRLTPCVENLVSWYSLGATAKEAAGYRKAAMKELRKLVKVDWCPAGEGEGLSTCAYSSIHERLLEIYRRKRSAIK